MASEWNEVIERIRAIQQLQQLVDNIRKPDALTNLPLAVCYELLDRQKNQPAVFNIMFSPELIGLDWLKPKLLLGH